MTEQNDNILVKLGFSFKHGSVLTKRTMMLNELRTVFNYIYDVNAERQQYNNAIIDENCTSKRSFATRQYTASYLTDLYMLEPAYLLFRALRYYWERDEEGQAMIAFLSAFARDSLLQSLTPYIFSLEINQSPSKEILEQYIEDQHPARFSSGMKASLGRNLLSAWTQAGFLQGRVKKVRVEPTITAGAVAYALLLSYLSGCRGERMFTSQYSKVLDCSTDKAMELAGQASRKGWLIFKHVGNVIEVQFSNLINAQEMELLREQS